MREFVKKFTNKRIIDFSRVIKLGSEFYLTENKLRKVSNRIKKKPSLIGIYLGRADKPSLFLLQEIAKHAEKKVWASKKGEWLFICKRNLLPESIFRTSGSLKPDDFVLVLNQYDECLGYGQMDKKNIVKRIFDIGDFLRRERKK